MTFTNQQINIPAAALPGCLVVHKRALLPRILKEWSRTELEEHLTRSTPKQNLGEQAEQEFMSSLLNDDNGKFTELYSLRRLKFPFIAGSSQVCISTIQRMYSILE
jgi:hypothetical protein